MSMRNGEPPYGPTTRSMGDYRMPAVRQASLPATFAIGQVIDERYRILGSLGSGGMGEVWRAYDVKLQVELALKCLPPERSGDEIRRDRLRKEVRSARDVVSPNVCRVYDLEVAEGQELVSMEYIDGETLTAVMEARGPLDLREAGEIAAQLLAGLSAIHEADLVHRDLKPDNIMITRAGRVVVMDFGVAQEVTAEPTGTISGTPVYMPPEQHTGQALDARADVFAVGVVLAEMTNPEGGSREARERVWDGIREVPPRLPDGPWQAVLTKAVAEKRDERYESAFALARALEDVTLRVDRTEDKHPYPGLSAFTEENAEFFFGREAEVEAVWKKLQHPRLLALIGPSGAGKSSFIRAGLLPAKPEGWQYLICQPGEAPFRALGQAMVPELSGDTDEIKDLMSIDDPEIASRLIARWRSRADEAVLVVDQFEELFTLNPPQVQERFAWLLGRLPVEADVRVLLSMRDDFLFRCHEFAALAPLFSDLTPIGAPTGAARRRALVQPALGCGYRFEEESIVDEMLGEIAGERGALPLLAFAAARLWEKRDREAGTLTRVAYEEIGGVSGALAQHAETTLEALGVERLEMVREVFRNLVTAEGTRATREMEELLSVFEEPEVARKVVTALIDARLLTSYDIADVTGQVAGRQGVEIVHESLLNAWPRLVKWRTQDEDGALLRDQLRQAAKAWHERGRPDDLLWTGSAYLDYCAWRERYAGGLSEVEENFSRAMVSHAERKRRNRRIAVSAILVALLVVLGVVSGLWRDADQARQESDVARRTAESEKVRTEASRLVALGRMAIEGNPWLALAWARTSLQLAASEESRSLALDALDEAPPGFFFDRERGSRWSMDISSDGKWLAAGNYFGEISLRHQDGTHVRTFQAHTGVVIQLRFSPGGERLMSLSWVDKTLAIWSLPGGELIARMPVHSGADVVVHGDRILTVGVENGESILESWTLDGEDRRILRRLPAAGDYAMAIDPTTSRLALTVGKSVRLLQLDGINIKEDILLGRHDAGIFSTTFHSGGDWIATGDVKGEIRLWSLAPGAKNPDRVIRNPLQDAIRLASSPDGKTLAAADPKGAVLLWDLGGPPAAEPITLRTFGQANGVRFHPHGGWIAAAQNTGVAMWPLPERSPRVLRGHNNWVTSVRFSPDGSLLLSASADGAVKSWSLRASPAQQDRLILDGNDGIWEISLSPDWKHLLAAAQGEKSVFLFPVEGGSPRQLSGFSVFATTAALGPQARFAAAGGGWGDKTEALIRIWDLETGHTRVLDAGDGEWIRDIAITPDGRHLLSAAGKGGARIWDLATATSRLLCERASDVAVDKDGHYALTAGGGKIMLHDLVQGSSRTLRDRGENWSRSAYGIPVQAIFGAGDLVISGDGAGVIRVGAIDSEEVTELRGHKGAIMSLAVHPNGEWIASGDAKGTIRLWPLPVEGHKLHALPDGELIKKLGTLTNAIYVKDEPSASGYRLENEPFKGWETLPEQ